MSTVKCECGNPDCVIKLNVEDREHIMLTSKYGDGCLMYTNKQSRRKLCSQFGSDNTLARDLVALLFWRWRKAKQEKKWAQDQVGEFTNNAFESYELEAQCAFLDARAHLLNKTKGDE